MEGAIALESISYPTGLKRAIIVATCITASLLQMIDSTVVNVCLRHIAGSVGASTTDVAWVITAYAISNVIIIPLSAMLSELFGQKNYFTVSILIFTFASLMCGYSTELWQLIFWRCIQGLGGGALMAQSQTILTSAFPPEKLGMASVIYGIGISVGPALGPTLGGFIADNYSWNWIFFINVPLGLIAAAFSWMVVTGEKNPARKNNIDWWGILFLAIGIGSLQYVLEDGNSKNWFDDNNIIAFSIIAAVGLITFIIIEIKTNIPAVNIKLLKHRNLAMGFFFNFMMGAIMYIAIYSFPLMVQLDLGWTATICGMSMIPGALMSIVGMNICQHMMTKGTNPKTLMACGLLCTAIFGIWMCYQSPDSSWWGLFYPMLFRGLGVGMFMMPAIIMSIEGLKGVDLGQGAGLANMAKQLGSAVGIALIATYISDTQAANQAMLSNDITQYASNSSTAMSGMSHMIQGMGYNADNANTLCYKIFSLDVFKQSTLLSYLSSFRILAVTALISLFLLILVKNDKKAKQIKN